MVTQLINVVFPINMKILILYTVIGNLFTFHSIRRSFSPVYSHNSLSTGKNCLLFSSQLSSKPAPASIAYSSFCFNVAESLKSGSLSRFMQVDAVGRRSCSPPAF